MTTLHRVFFASIGLLGMACSADFKDEASSPLTDTGDTSSPSGDRDGDGDRDRRGASSALSSFRATRSGVDTRSSTFRATSWAPVGSGSSGNRKVDCGATGSP